MLGMPFEKQLGARADHRVEFAFCQHVGEGAVVRDRREVDVGWQLERRALLASCLLDAACAPVDVGGFHAIFVLQDAADPDVGGDLVLGQADGLAFQVSRRFDAAVGAYVDARMPEQARNERGHTDVGVLAARSHQGVAGHRHLGDVELLVLEGTVEGLFRFDRDSGDFAALDRRTAVEDRTGAVVITDGEADFECVLHGGSP